VGSKEDARVGVYLRIGEIALSQGGVVNIYFLFSSGPAHKLVTVLTELPHLVHYKVPESLNPR